MKGSTKPSGLLYYGAFLTLELVRQRHDLWWLFIIYLFCMAFDAFRVSNHEIEHRCG